MKELKLFKTFLHSEYGEVKTIDKMYFHPLTQKEGVFFKVQEIKSNPVVYHYVSQSELLEEVEK